MLTLPPCELIGFSEDGRPLRLGGLPLLRERLQGGGEIVFTFRHRSFAFLYQAFRALRRLRLRGVFRLPRFESFRAFLGLGFASR